MTDKIGEPSGSAPPSPTGSQPVDVDTLNSTLAEFAAVMTSTLTSVIDDKLAAAAFHRPQPFVLEDNASIKLASDSDCDTPVSKDRTSGTMKDPDLAAIHACITQCYAQRASDPTAALVASIQQRARRRKQKNRLILVKAKLGSVQVTCLVDSGAEASLVSEAVQRAAGLKTTPGEKLLVQGWDGSQRECGRVLRNISLVAGEYSGQHTFVVAPLEGSFDVILGNDWLHANAEAYKVHTDRGMVELHQRNGIVARLYAIDSPESKTYASASAATVERWKKQDEIEDCVQVSLHWASDEEEDLVAKPLEPDIRTDEEKRAAIEKMRVDLDGVKCCRR
ncbi:hypothetical protein Ndes2526B_g03947 [Nannochloris sp. 'desiccata']